MSVSIMTDAPKPALRFGSFFCVRVKMCDAFPVPPSCVRFSRTSVGNIEAKMEDTCQCCVFHTRQEKNIDISYEFQ